MGPAGNDSVLQCKRGFSIRHVRILKVQDETFVTIPVQGTVIIRRKDDSSLCNLTLCSSGAWKCLAKRHLRSPTSSFFCCQQQLGKCQHHVRNNSVYLVNFAVSTSWKAQDQESSKQHYSAQDQQEVNSLSSPEQTGWKMQNQTPNNFLHHADQMIPNLIRATSLKSHLLVRKLPHSSTCTEKLISETL